MSLQKAEWDSRKSNGLSNACYFVRYRTRSMHNGWLGFLSQCTSLTNEGITAEVTAGGILE